MSEEERKQHDQEIAEDNRARQIRQGHISVESEETVEEEEEKPPKPEK